MKKIAPIAGSLLALVASTVCIAFCISYVVSRAAAEAPQVADALAVHVGTFAAQVHAPYEKGQK
ncbi:hypothetical protein [Paraburkholderia sediminicola]|uniref:hypothetical protein n=1 Tax=Paraburkholderia sediminicola TaxID=458836 RepID=UPI0038B9D33F